MSDILIKDMEMPKSCAGCPTCREGTTLDGDYWLMCGYNGKPLESEIGAGKPDWCPLVPVTPHGRLIVFPCEVDDVLYEVDDPSFGVIVCKVYSVNYSRQRARLADDEEMRDCVSVLVKVIEGHGIGSSYSFGMEDFGKSIFLTREEAEAALVAPTIIPVEEGET